MMSASNQALVFLSTVYAGFIIGFVYDLYRLIRRIAKPGYIITGILDLLFWIVIGAFSFIVLFKVNSGQVRPYNIAGLAIGWSLYALILSSYVMKALQFFSDIIGRTIRFIVHIIVLPFKWLAKPFLYLGRLMKGMVKPLNSIINKIRKK